jgi:hypothetical protein
MTDGWRGSAPHHHPTRPGLTMGLGPPGGLGVGGCKMLWVVGRSSGYSLQRLGGVCGASSCCWRQQRREGGHALALGHARPASCWWLAAARLSPKRPKRGGIVAVTSRSSVRRSALQRILPWLCGSPLRCVACSGRGGGTAGLLRPNQERPWRVGVARCVCCCTLRMEVLGQSQRCCMTSPVRPQPPHQVPERRVQCFCEVKPCASSRLGWEALPLQAALGALGSCGLRGARIVAGLFCEAMCGCCLVLIEACGVCTLLMPVRRQSGVIATRACEGRKAGQVSLPPIPPVRSILSLVFSTMHCTAGTSVHCTAARLFVCCSGLRSTRPSMALLRAIVVCLACSQAILGVYEVDVVD